MNTLWKSLPVRKMMFVLLALVAISVMVTGLSAQSADEPACEGEYLESVRETGLTYIGALNANDLQPWIDILADDYQFYPIGTMDPVGSEEAIATAEGTIAVFPGLQTEIHMSAVSSDCRYVTFLWTSTAVFGGPIGDIQPTGQETAISGISVTEVEDGQIVSEWVSYDQLTLLSSLGLVTLGPPADAAVEPTMEATEETGS